MRDAIETALEGQAKIYGAGAERLTNTTCIGMPGVSAETQVMAFDLAGIAVSAGSACSSGKVRASRVLRAMGASMSRKPPRRCAFRSGRKRRKTRLRNSSLRGAIYAPGQKAICAPGPKAI